jgi:hypothetical protein
MSIFDSNYKFNMTVDDEVSGPVDSMEKSVGKSLGSVVNVFSNTFKKLTGHVSKTETLLYKTRDSIEKITIKSPFGTFSESTATDVLGMVDYHKTLLDDLGKTQAQAKEMSDRMFKSVVNQEDLITSIDAFIEDGAEEKIGDMMNLFTTEMGYVPENFKKAFIESASLVGDYMDGKRWVALGERMGVDISKGMKKQLESETISPKVKASMLSEGAKDFKTRVTPKAEPTTGMGKMMGGLGKGMKGMFKILKVGMKFFMQALLPLKLLADLLAPALEALMDMIEPILMPFQMIILELVEAFRPFMNILGEVLLDLLDEAGPYLDDFARGMVKFATIILEIPKYLGIVWNFIVDFFEGFINIYMTAYGFIYNGMMNFFYKIINGVIDLLNNIPGVNLDKKSREDVDWTVDLSGMKADVSDSDKDKPEPRADEQGMPIDEFDINQNYSDVIPTGLPSKSGGMEPVIPVRDDFSTPKKNEEDQLGRDERLAKVWGENTNKLIAAIAKAAPNPEEIRTIASDTLGLTRYA